MVTLTPLITFLCHITFFVFHNFILHQFVNEMLLALLGGLVLLPSNASAANYVWECISLLPYLDRYWIYSELQVRRLSEYRMYEYHMYDDMCVGCQNIICMIISYHVYDAVRRIRRWSL